MDGRSIWPEPKGLLRRGVYPAKRGSSQGILLKPYFEANPRLEILCSGLYKLFY